MFMKALVSKSGHSFESLLSSLVAIYHKNKHEQLDFVIILVSVLVLVLL